MRGWLCVFSVLLGVAWRRTEHIQTSVGGVFRTADLAEEVRLDD